jgi:hypothetical protein
MTSPDRRIAFAAAIFALAVTSSPVLAAGNVSPFCIARGGGAEGGTPPEDCRYSDYQACLQASATLHGNCVQNIDYHGEVSTAPAPLPPTRARHRR